MATVDRFDEEGAFYIMWLVFSVLAALPVFVLAFLSFVWYRKVRPEVYASFFLLKLAWCSVLV
jgi:hypothetical protein